MLADKNDTTTRMILRLALTFIAGGILVCGIYSAIWYSGVVTHEYSSVWKMSSLMSDEADGYFELYRQGRVLEVICVPFFGGDINVEIVADLRGANYGFVKHENRFICVNEANFEVYSYNKQYLFVVLKDRYIEELAKQQDG